MTLRLPGGGSSARYGCIVLLTLLTACTPPAVGSANKPVLTEPPRSVPYERTSAAEVRIEAQGCLLDGVSTSDGSGTRRSLELTGDPGFTPERLSGDVRCWYEELWSILQDPGRSAYYTGRADRYDLYTYSREMNTHINALLTALRVTGDLAILDEVDRLAQHMRAKLDDAWTRGAGRDSGSRDGFLNWVWDRDGSDQHRGRDLHEIDEMRTHALVAQFAYAFRANEGLEGPNGVDYAERASFWTDYLVNHFEAKWRQRHDAPWPEFPFLTRPHMHETVDFIRYHHYLYLLTGRPEYRAEASRLTSIAMGNLVEVPTEAGPALVSPRSVLSLDGSQVYLMPSTYVRYLYASAIDLNLEGVDDWAQDDVLVELARSMSEFVIDNGADDFARDMGGGVDRGSVPASDAREWSRFTPGRYVISPYALLAAWDASGKIADVSRQIYSGLRTGQRDVFIPVAMLLDAALN
jgi:hypothetical protein